MIKEMLIKGGAIVAGILVAEALIEKLEKRSLEKYDEQFDDFMSDVEGDEHSFKEVDEAWEKLDKLGEEFEEEIAYQQK